MRRPGLVQGYSFFRIFIGMQIISMSAEHWPAVKAIYEEGIATGHATFQTEAPEWPDWDRGHLAHSRLIILTDAFSDAGEVAGWAALSPVSSRAVYAGVAEVSIYIRGSSRGRKAGLLLLRALVEESERHGIWTLQAGIFPENIPSLKIHAHCGFRQVGFRERIGAMEGVWRDTILLERRSAMVGL
jgi:L-amino acid N-acyltransferase YncA